MRVGGYARKRDANEADIVQALERIGVRVLRISESGAADLLCNHPTQGLVLVEVKSATGKLTKAQVGMRRKGWQVCVVRTVAEALALFGVRM